MTRGSTTALYSSSLVSSLEQKRSPRDLWELPKIPQWKSDRVVGKAYLVDQEALKNGSHHYASLLGTKLRGLSLSEGITRYKFTVQTSYIDLQCSLEKASDLEFGDYFFQGMPTPYTPSQYTFGYVAGIRTPISWKEWKILDDPPPLQLVYMPVLGSDLAALNCTMQTVWIETEIHCGPSPAARSCYAYRQRRMEIGTSSNRLPRLMIKSLGALRQVLAYWREASGVSSVNKASATDNYIRGELHPYAGQNSKTLSDLDPEMFSAGVSRRMTTAFNTFWDATLDPLRHTDMISSTLDGNSTAYEDEFNAQPFMNSTLGTMTVEHEVYHASPLWVAILLTTTLFLQILAILGLVLEVLIVGPEILGYASSLTRDSPYVPRSNIGSALGGPERARALGDIRLQLVDVRPNEDIGYLAVCAVPPKAVDEITEGSTETRDAEIVSEQVFLRKLDSKRLYR
ncbi:hypothetical protein FSPOR_2853 [Fusarium sporotrichioides]|uniref:Uncharacterized protein n=1 Tax=Fusarium sporotrichioides TaxID=5514 RepID=A0A395SIF8_FUSSP|nr:hypothetical protein FSPOR_2853 [Fusarium sporotrichioides]